MEPANFAAWGQQLSDAVAACRALAQEQESLQIQKLQLEALRRELDAEKAAFEKQTQQRLADAMKQLDEERARIAALQRGLEEEKAAMARFGAKPGDLITLNLGGEHWVRVKRSLLTQIEGSLLSAMFSGRHDDRLDRDADGNVFFDYSPAILNPLIEFLRLRRDCGPEELATLTWPEPEPAREAAWNSMMNFMGLSALLPSTITTFSGIRTDVSISGLAGWKVLFCKPYSHISSIDDFLVPLDYAASSFIVGARAAGSDRLLVAAMGNIEVVANARDDDSVTFHNGAYWYFNRRKSVGFAPTAKVVLYSADTETENGSLRLSWHLQGLGGWRVGEVSDLGGSSQYEKVILASTARV